MSNPACRNRLPEHFLINGGPGRPKGSKPMPKRYSHAELAKAAEERNYSPFIEMIELSRHPDCPFRVQFECHKELAQYLAPKQRPTQSIEVEHRNLNVSWNVNDASQPPSTTVTPPLTIEVEPSEDE